VILIVIFICVSKKEPVRLASTIAENDFHVQYHLPCIPVNSFVPTKTVCRIIVSLENGNFAAFAASYCE